MMPKPRLTAAVLDGLATLATHADAGSSADILGLDYDRLDAEGKQSWDNIERAIEWVFKMRKWRAS